jgi:hypothetical protein
MHSSLLSELFDVEFSRWKFSRELFQPIKVLRKLAEGALRQAQIRLLPSFLFALQLQNLGDDISISVAIPASQSTTILTVKQHCRERKNTARIPLPSSAQAGIQVNTRPEASSRPS